MKKTLSDLCNKSKMSQMVTIQLENPITFVKILDYADSNAIESSKPSQANSKDNAEQILLQELECQKTEFSYACQAVKAISDKLNHFYNTAFTEHSEGIAELSVEIARKILVQNVQEGHYETEAIVKEALKNTTVHQDIVVHLHPEDLIQYKKVQPDDIAGTSSDIKFVSDTNIGRAECLIETPKGIIQSLIDTHLERVAKALKDVKCEA